MLGHLQPMPVMTRVQRLASLVWLPLAACSHQPPADFVPDPSLVSHIRSIEMHVPQYACPGLSFDADYVAILDDGARIPFAERYDRKHPPRLHVVFLERNSYTATALQGGGWTPEHDPLVTLRSGFRLNAYLRDKPAIADSVTVAPSYECLRHAFSFEGPTGPHGQTGGDGPDVTVRIGILRTPFYDRLIVAGIEVGEAPPFYVVGDGRTVPPRDWLIVASQGGRGGQGEKGTRGRAGPKGNSGCPGTNGADGEDGQPGARGGDGGRGGHITIIVPSENPFLSGLVDARVDGGGAGPGGTGGEAGQGGEAGDGGNDRNGQACTKGNKGRNGRAGVSGQEGRPGVPGPRPQVITVPGRSVFGPRAPQELLDLMR